MNQIRRWVEQSNSESGGTRCSSARPSVMIRTTNSYDENDETFSIVALNLLSRYAYFGLTPGDAILNTLATAKDRSNFLEALLVRKMYCNQQHHHLSPSTVSLIQTVDTSFGKDLLQIVETESGTSDLQHLSNHHFGHGLTKPHPSQRRWSDEYHTHRHTKGKRCSPGKRPRSFFFPDTSNLFVAGAKGKVTTRNIEWKLAEAIEQVSSLRLDGMELESRSATYQAPSTTSARL